MAKPRSLQIAASLGSFGWAWWRWHKRSPERLPDLLTRTVERLGTTFIKLAQALSLRWDVLPRPYREALGQLQSHAAPFAPEASCAAIEAAFERPVEDLFVQFERTPFAAASVAQLHRARLADGREVVVKVRRPGIAVLIRRDLRLLKTLVAMLSWAWPGLRRQQPAALIDELGEQLLREVDLRHEAQNVRRLSKALQDRPELYVPAVIEPLVSEAVLVQEFAPGRALADVFGQDEGQRLAKVLLDAYLHQFFVIGVFHADPHPGNLFAREDGRLCLHDFGLVGTLDLHSRRALARLMEAVVYRDATAALDAAVALGFISGPIDRRALERGIDSLLSELQGQPLAEWSIAETMWRIAQLAGGRRFRIPRELLLLLRALFLLENTTRALSPRFDLVAELLARRDDMQQALSTRGTSTTPGRPAGQLALRAVRGVPPLLAHWLQQAQADNGMPPLAVHHRGLERLESSLRHSTNRLVIALLALGLYVGGAVLMLHSAGPALLGIPVAAIMAFVAASALAAWIIVAVLRSDGL